MASNMSAWALHGFLGLGSDWDFLSDPMIAGPRLSQLDFFKPDLFSHAPRGESLADEAVRIGKFLNERTAPQCLIGYSYGGRLAVELALQFPHAFSKLILVSTGFGMANSELRFERAQRDEQWAQDFLTQPWDALMAKWNSLEVLAPPLGHVATELLPPSKESSATTHSLLRIESNYNRACLAEAQRLRSPAVGPYQLARLAQIKVPVLLVLGAADTPYIEAAEKAQGQLPQARIEIVDRASHRVPWQQPLRFCQMIDQFIFS